MLPIVEPSFVKPNMSPLWKPPVTPTAADVCVVLSRSVTVMPVSIVTADDAPT